MCWLQPVKCSPGMMNPDRCLRGNSVDHNRIGYFGISTGSISCSCITPSLWVHHMSCSVRHVLPSGLVDTTTPKPNSEQKHQGGLSCSLVFLRKQLFHWKIDCLSDDFWVFLPLRSDRFLVLFINPTFLWLKTNICHICTKQPYSTITCNKYMRGYGLAF